MIVRLVTDIAEVGGKGCDWGDIKNKPDLQEELVSGTNIKTINGNDILGSGDLVLETGKVDDVQVDGASVITDKIAKIDLSGKQDKLVDGENIKTVNGGTLLGSGDLVISGGKVFDTYESMINDLNEASATKYNTAQAFYISTNDVPDVFVSAVDESVSVELTTTSYESWYKTGIEVKIGGSYSVNMGDTTDYELYICSTEELSSESSFEQVSETITESKIAGWLYVKTYDLKSNTISYTRNESYTYTDDATLVSDLASGIVVGHYTLRNIESKVPSLTGYATEEWVEGKGYLTSESDPIWTAEKTNYYTKSEIDTILGDVETAINNIAG